MLGLEELLIRIDNLGNDFGDFVTGSDIFNPMRVITNVRYFEVELMQPPHHDFSDVPFRVTLVPND